MHLYIQTSVNTYIYTNIYTIHMCTNTGTHTPTSTNTRLLTHKRPFIPASCLKSSCRDEERPIYLLSFRERCKTPRQGSGGGTVWAAGSIFHSKNIWTMIKNISLDSSVIEHVIIWFKKAEFSSFGNYHLIKKLLLVWMLIRKWYIPSDISNTIYRGISG